MGEKSKCGKGIESTLEMWIHVGESTFPMLGVILGWVLAHGRLLEPIDNLIISFVSKVE